MKNFYYNHQKHYSCPLWQCFLIRGLTIKLIWKELNFNVDLKANECKNIKKCQLQTCVRKLLKMSWSCHIIVTVIWIANVELKYKPIWELSKSEIYVLYILTSLQVLYAPKSLSKLLFQRFCAKKLQKGRKSNKIGACLICF